MFKVIKTLERSQLTSLQYLSNLIRLRSSHMRCSIIKAVLKNIVILKGKHLCWSFFLIKLQDFRPITLLKETRTQVFSCEYYNIFKNTYFEKHLPTAASVNCNKFYRATENQYWNGVWIKIKIYGLLWNDFTTCPAGLPTPGGPRGPWSPNFFAGKLFFVLWVFSF